MYEQAQLSFSSISPKVIYYHLSDVARVLTVSEHTVRDNVWGERFDRQRDPTSEERREPPVGKPSLLHLR
jgi:hypothetical protein